MTFMLALWMETRGRRWNSCVSVTLVISIGITSQKATESASKLQMILNTLRILITWVYNCNSDKKINIVSHSARNVCRYINHGCTMIRIVRAVKNTSHFSHFGVAMYLLKYMCISAVRVRKCAFVLYQT